MGTVIQGSELNRKFHIQLPGRQIIGHAILPVVYILYPDIGNGIVHLQQVQYFGADPYIADMPE